VASARGPLHGLRVVEAATLAAGPMVATALGEFGADVVKVEQPGAGDPMRTWGDRRDGVGLAWKSVSRNKRCVTLDLRRPEGQELAHRLLDVSDVFIVGNRPSALARWGLDYESVHDVHPHLVMLHVSGYGRGGPKSDRPGYGTLVEAMSGFAHVTGQPDGPPTLPPFMLADGVAALAATYAVMMALYNRDVHGGGGQLLDVSLIEPLARLIETQTLAFDQLGVVAQRVGNRLDASAPATPTAPPTTTGWRSRARRRASSCACTAPSAGPTWPTTPTTSIPLAAGNARSRSTTWLPSGWASALSTRPWASSRRPRSRRRRSTTPRSSWRTSTCAPGARSSPTTTPTSGR
jgi:crotonobetainyl-CoA:carnitine CoA-transferase CaiB-like acyl-CoA transferase